MITLNQNNSKKIYGNKYLYNLVCNENINIKNLIIKSNIKKNIIFGFIGKETKYVFNLEYEEDESQINQNINLYKGNNYIFIHSVSNKFEIIINENINLGIIKFKEVDMPYTINTNNYYDFFMKKNKLYFFAYIDDISNDNFYEIKINNNKINKYDKYQNFYNFLGSIYINEDKLYTIEFNMKYYINVNKLIIIYDNIIENKTNYENKMNSENMYNINPIISYKDISLNAYYIELKLIKYNNYTRISFDKNNRIVLKIINNILFINDKKLFVYNKNEYIKFVFNYDDKLENTIIYLFNNLPYKRIWEKIFVIKHKITFFQKLYEINYYDSHFNNKSITFRKAFIFECNSMNRYIDNIDFKYFDNKPKIFLNNYTLTIGGDINKNLKQKNKNYRFKIINFNNPLTNYTIDKIGIKLIRECFNYDDTIKKSIIKKINTDININNTDKTSQSSNIDNKKNSIKKNNISDINIMNSIQLNKTLNIIQKKNFMFSFENKNIFDLLKMFIVITIIFLIAIKIHNKLI